MNVIIYGLVDPVNSEIKYIGKTKQTLSKRLSAHLCESNKSNTKKNTWLRALKQKGFKPRIEEIDTVSELEWEFWEQYWICQFNVWGFKLKNTDEGGKGQSSEFMKKNNPMFKMKNRKKISQSLLGNIRAKGFKHSEITKNKVKKNHAKFWKNKERNQRTKDKISKTKSNPIYQFNLNGIFIKKFTSVKEAILKTQSNRTALYKCLNNKIDICNGFIWSWHPNYPSDVLM